MSEMRYTEDHEWLRIEGDVATCGITDYAQEQLGDVVFVELPAVGSSYNAGDEAAVVESVKAAAEVYAPLAGEIVAVNDAIVDDHGQAFQQCRAVNLHGRQLHRRSESQLVIGKQRERQMEPLCGFALIGRVLRRDAEDVRNAELFEVIGMIAERT